MRSRLKSAHGKRLKALPVTGSSLAKQLQREGLLPAPKKKVLPARELSGDGQCLQPFPVRAFQTASHRPYGPDFTEKTFALHALLEDAKRLVDIVVSH